MGGRIVPMLGGPLDGLEHHRDIDKTTRTYYVVPNDPRHGVHVYTSRGSRNAPYRYQGVRDYQQGDEPYAIPTISQPESP